MRLRRPAILLGLLVIVLAAGAWGLPYAAGLRSDPVPFAEACELAPEQVAEIVIRDGVSGETALSSAPQHIEELFDLMSQSDWKPDRSRDRTVGWTYYVDLARPGGDVTRITFKGQATEVDWFSSQDGYKVTRSQAYRLADGDADGILAGLTAMFAELSTH